MCDVQVSLVVLVYLQSTREQFKRSLRLAGFKAFYSLRASKGCYYACAVIDWLYHVDLQVLQKTKASGPLAEVALLDIPVTLEEEEADTEKAPVAQVYPGPRQP